MMEKKKGFWWLFAGVFLSLTLINITIAPRVIIELSSQFTFRSFGRSLSRVIDHSLSSYLILIAAAVILAIILTFILIRIKPLNRIRGLNFFFTIEFLIFFSFVYVDFLKWFHSNRLIRPDQNFLTSAGITATIIITILFIIVGLLLFYATKYVVIRIKSRRGLNTIRKIVLVILAIAVIFIITKSLIESSSYTTADRVMHTYNSENISDYNILLLTWDALRYDHLGYAGYYRNTSPVLDSLAKESVVFTHSTTAWPKTTPSFAILFTGLYGKTNGVRRQTKLILPDRLLTLAEVLQENGYYTIALAANTVLATIYNFDQGFYEYHEHNRALSVTNVQTSSVLAKLRSIKDEKFFMWVHYIDPHGPYNSRGEFYQMFINDSYYDPHIEIELSDTTYAEKRNKIPGVVQIDGINKTDYYIAEYDAEIRFNDFNMKRIFDELDRLEIRNKTIIIFASDHGESLGDHDYYFGHGLLGYDACTRIPLMFNAPWLFENRTINYPVSNVDLMPTILSFLKIEIPENLQGQDLRPVITGEKGEETLNRYVFSEAGYVINHYIRNVRDDRWKLIYTPNKYVQEIAQGVEFELYDLENDPHELENVADQYPEKVEELKKVLFEWMEKDVVPPVT